eukprot:5764440-Amphidinium_carterae.1
MKFKEAFHRLFRELCVGVLEVVDVHGFQMHNTLARLVPAAVQLRTTAMRMSISLDGKGNPKETLSH